MTFTMLFRFWEIALTNIAMQSCIGQRIRYSHIPGQQKRNAGEFRRLRLRKYSVPSHQGQNVYPLVGDGPICYVTVRHSFSKLHINLFHTPHPSICFKF